MVYSFCRFLSFLILKLFFHIEVKGRENIPTKGGFIVASNHVSFMDPIAVGVASPRALNYMARHDLFCNPLFGWLIAHCNSFPVKRNSADFSALREAMRRVKSGGGLAIFPEGSRKADGESLEPQAGIGFLASKLNVPVVPAFVKGTEIALPRGTKKLKAAKISVNFGEKIHIERGRSYQDIAATIMSSIKKLSD